RQRLATDAWTVLVDNRVRATIQPGTHLLRREATGYRCPASRPRATPLFMMMSHGYQLQGIVCLSQIAFSFGYFGAVFN
ncbi:hypothetical protein, partial [Klebsiella pneumoniae]|uniref:hypothetical protein n=1 Tax=Klebsiella pneumoniae TaxID=573 RepID=UPI00210D9B62